MKRERRHRVSLHLGKPKKQLRPVKSKLEQNKIFKQRFDKLKVIEFKPDEECSWMKHFRFPKSIIAEAQLSQKALIVYPVLCSQANFEEDNWFQISLENIAKLSGLTAPTVQKALEELIGCNYRIKTKGIQVPILERRLTSNGSRHYYIYRVGFIRKDMIKKSKDFVFYTDLIDSGIWARLSRRAKLFYLALKNVAYFDASTYSKIEGYPESDLISKGEFDFSIRKWDVCNSTRKELCNAVGIGSSDIYRVIRELEDKYLIETIGRYFKVWVKLRDVEH